MVSSGRRNETGEPAIYLEVGSGVTTLILLGRYFESRAKRQSGAALRALLPMGAKDVAILRGDLRTAVDAIRL